jgi:hypothetical protein
MNHPCHEFHLNRMNHYFLKIRYFPNYHYFLKFQPFH